MYILFGGKLCAKYTKYTLEKARLSIEIQPERGERNALISPLMRMSAKFLTSFTSRSLNLLMTCSEQFFLGRVTL